MDDTKMGVLTPAQRRAMQQGVADCASCKSKLQYLREIGTPNEELEARSDHTQAVLQTALAIDQQRRAEK